MTAPKKPALKPCPFCGSKPVYGHTRGQVKYPALRMHWVECPNGQCMVGFAEESKTAVIERWNRRVK